MKQQVSSFTAMCFAFSSFIHFFYLLYVPGPDENKGYPVSNSFTSHPSPTFHHGISFVYPFHSSIFDFALVWSGSVRWVCVSTSTAARRFPSSWWLPPTAGSNNCLTFKAFRANINFWLIPPGRVCSPTTLPTSTAFSSDAHEPSSGEELQLKVQKKLFVCLQTARSLSHFYGTGRSHRSRQLCPCRLRWDGITSHKNFHPEFFSNISLSSRAMGVLETRQWGEGSSGKCTQYSCAR